jgi:hypothetical protein
MQDWEVLWPADLFHRETITRQKLPGPGMWLVFIHAKSHLFIVAKCFPLCISPNLFFFPSEHFFLTKFSMISFFINLALDIWPAI